MNRDGAEPIGLELTDFGAGRAAIMDAAEKGQVDSVKDLLENGVADLRLLTMHLFRIAFKNNNLEMVNTLIPFGKERELQVRIGILEDAVKTENIEIINIVRSGLEITDDVLKPGLLERVKKLLSPGNTDDALLPREITNDLSQESFMVTLEQLDEDEIDSNLVEKVMATGNNEKIYILAEVISRSGFTTEHRGIFTWLIENWPDPELISQLDDVINPKTSTE